MAEIDYRPRSVTEILDASFRVLRDNYPSFVILAAISYFPAAVLNLLLRRYVGLEAQPSVTFGWEYFVVLLLQVVIFQLMTSLISIMASRAYLQEPLDPSSTWKVALPRFFSVLMSGLILVVSCLVGFMFLIFPGIYVYTRYGLAPTIAAIDGHGVNGSLARSSFLSRGNKLRIFGVTLLTLTLYFVLVIGLAILGTVLPGFFIRVAIGFIGTVLVWPLLPIVQTVLYYDLRIRAEAFDVDIMSRRLDLVSPSPVHSSF